MLTDLYLLPLLSGQSVDMPKGLLKLAPKFAPPYVLPVLLAGVEASMECKSKGRYTLYVAFGNLKLPAGGLSVDGIACHKDVDLGAGQSISWHHEI